MEQSIFSAEYLSSTNFQVLYRIISFQYSGPDTRILIRDSGEGRIVADQFLKNGENFLFFGSAADELVFLNFPHIELKNLLTVDLFRERALDWETIAEIRVKDAISASYDQVISRYDPATILTRSEWDEFVQLMQSAQNSVTSSSTRDDSNLWQAVNLIIGARWEFAVLFGYGFADGPHLRTNSIDTIDISKILSTIPKQVMAYRVKELGRGDMSSNIALCYPWLAGPLVPPSALMYSTATVRLKEENQFEASTVISWNQANGLNILGTEFEEEIGSSRNIGSLPISNFFENRSRKTTDSISENTLLRILDVPFHDVLLRVRARSVDGWDRVSVFSHWSMPTPLRLEHTPTPPALVSAVHRDGVTKIRRQLANSGSPVWKPDVVVDKSRGKIFIYRKTGDPKSVSGRATSPIQVNGSLYKTNVNVPNHIDFKNGFIIAGNITMKIDDVIGSDFFFNGADSGASFFRLFSEGPVILLQDPGDISLWTKVSEFSALDLPAELIFNDPVVLPPYTTTILSYHARISYLDRLSPPSNIAQAISLARNLNSPPPFTASSLGIDFYMRTLVQIQFTNPVVDGSYSIWWADGIFDEEQFSLQAVPGTYLRQTVHRQLYLYDILSLPIPRHRERIVTLGIQQQNEYGLKSPFVIGRLILRPI